LGTILKNGGSLSDSGFIGFSTKRRNLIISNAIACAAWNGHKDMLDALIGKMGK
jgi:hypothetical protein